MSCPSTLGMQSGSRYPNLRGMTADCLCRGDEERGGGMMGGFGGSMGGVGGNSKAKRPINVKFEIPYFTTSGIQVRYLKIIEPKVRLENHLARQSARVCADNNVCVAAIPVSAVGAVYHSVGRHCC